MCKMVKKTTSKEVKTAAVVHKKKKKKVKHVPTPMDIAIQTAYNFALSGNVVNNPDRMAVARALNVLRIVEMKKEPSVEFSINAVYKECKEKVFRTVLESALAHDLRFVDVAIILEMFNSDANLLASWEFENLDMIELLLDNISFTGAVSETTESTIKAVDLLKSLGTTVEEPEDETDD